MTHIRSNYVLWCVLFLASHPYAHAQTSSSEVLFIRMPDEPAVSGPVTKDAVEHFLQRWGRYVLNSASELLQPEAQQFARQVLGQRAIFHELELCEKALGIRVRVQFIPWMFAFRFLEQTADSGPPRPMVVQLGDTWYSYFDAKHVIAGTPRRHTWDPRFLWYNRALMYAEDFADGHSFERALQRVAAHPTDNLQVPFALSAAPEWDLLHTLATVFYMFSREPFLRQRSFGPWHWWTAQLTGPDRRQAIQWLIKLRMQGVFDPVDCTNVELTDAFLDGKYACILAPPWVALWAKKRWGEKWSQIIGVAWPPSMTGQPSGTFLGGSLLAIFAAPGTVPAQLRNEVKVIEFLTSRESQERYVINLGFIPPCLELLKKSWAPLYPLAVRAVNEGIRHPDCPLWPAAVENVIVRDHLYILHRWLATVAPPRSEGETSYEKQREKLIWDTLRSAEQAVNERLRQHLWSRIAVALVGVLVLAATGWAVSAWGQRRRILRLLQERATLAQQLRIQERINQALTMLETTASPLQLSSQDSEKTREE
jgi:hypothetical protein